MNVLIIGQGGREHAIAKKIKESALCKKLWVSPGNAGMSLQDYACVPAMNSADTVTFCKENSISLAILGPEAAIISDLKMILESAGIFCCAPPAAGAVLESSKLFCKDILVAAGIPTAAYQQSHNFDDAKKFILAHDFSQPLVLKADGLAQGKGVAVCENREQALENAQQLTENYGFPLVIEEFLQGRELSAFALCDGEDFVVLGTACDYKRINSDPFSANTGGMGAYSPCDFIDGTDDKKIHEIFVKSLRELKKRDIHYQGFLFAGLMKTAKDLYVLEFNVRMGDPETQVLLPRLDSDLLELVMRSAQHELKNAECRLKKEFAVHVVMASEGYPQKNMKLSQTISVGAETLQNLYFAGVQSAGDGKLLNSGGRVMGVTAVGSSKEEARRKAYQMMHGISFSGMYFRKDIAQ
jgi:phosphoribosylamine--glycine ligase